MERNRASLEPNSSSLMRSTSKPMVSGMRGGPVRPEAPSVQSPLGAGILPVEHTIRRWRVGTAQHASETSCGRTTGCYDAIPIRGRENKVRARLGDGAVPRVQNGLTRRHVKFKFPIGQRRHARVGNGEVGDETGLPRMCHRQRRCGRGRMSCGADGESEDGNHQCRHGYVKRCAAALHANFLSGHSSRH